ncbi:hypothetical protein, partial [Escherichia coli]|uniref:hypothetical protein n=1 Tax=Escherichia coli TaxID=562 RepID=UPI001BD3910E
CWIEHIKIRQLHKSMYRLEQSDPLRLLCQTVTHRIPAKWYLNQSQSGIPPIRDRIERNTQPRQIRAPFSRYRPVIPENQPITAHASGTIPF